MARRRFFVSEVTKGGAVIEGEDARHLTRVLRVELGQRYEISDGERAYLAEVVAARKEFVEFRIVEDLPPAPKTVSVTLLASLIKFDHFELLIEKATELGVSEIVPVIATRTEFGLEKAVPKRTERWLRIAAEASQQSRRDRLPKISPAVQFGNALAWDVRSRYWLDEEPGGAPLWMSVPAERSADDSVALLVGPEGGWTDAERAAACRRPGWSRIWMGQRILRTETAAMAALAVIMAAWQETP
jgi:16S rRNA (uracil1498-N3)-methyltransferase